MIDGRRETGDERRRLRKYDREPVSDYRRAGTIVSTHPSRVQFPSPVSRLPFPA